MNEYLKDLVEKGKSLVESLASWREALPERTETVDRNYFDTMDWKDLLSVAKELRDNLNGLDRTYDYVPDWFEDFFNLLHQGSPLVADESDMNPDYRQNLAMTEGFAELPAMTGLRLSTRFDKYATGMAMTTMQPAIEATYRNMEQARQAEQARQDKAKELLDRLRDLAQAIAHAAQTAHEDEPEKPDEPQDSGEQGDGDGQAQQDYEQALAQYEQDHDEWQQRQDDAAAQVQQAMNAVQQAADEADVAVADAKIASEQGQKDSEQAMKQAAEQAADERQQEADLMQAFGVGDGELQKMDYQERANLAKRLMNNRMAQFARLIGQFRQLGQAERRRKVVHKPDVVVDVELGGSLTLLTPTELMNMSMPETETDFWRRWAENALLNYKMEGTERLGRGPIIVVCDESGSMGWGAYDMTSLGEGASPEAWSKALSLALLDQARDGNRDFHYIGFSSMNQVWHKEFPDGRGTLDDIIEFTEHFYGGGTSYEQPLNDALRIVQEYGARDLPKPDIVFITDAQIGDLPIPFLEAWQQAKDDLSMTVYGILIGVPMSGAFESVCDSTMMLDDMLHDPDMATSMFRTL